MSGLERVTALFLAEENIGSDEINCIRLLVKELLLPLSGNIHCLIIL